MDDNYKHLRFEKETLENPRRTRQYNIPKTPRGDLAAHGRHLNDELAQALKLASASAAANPARFFLKLGYSGMVDFKNLYKHGVEFISQEDSHVCIVFADETGLAQFSAHLSRLGIEGDELSYRQILEALDGVDNWTRGDRESWAVKKFGLPKKPNFRLDVELWPMESQHHPMRIQFLAEFEQWLRTQNVQQIDRVNLDSLTLPLFRESHNRGNYATRPC